MKRQNRNPMAAFTRVELIVVIAMTAALAAVVAPALAASKLRSHTAGCLDNQRQLALGWLIYSEDHNGRIVGMGDGTVFDWRIRPGTGPFVTPPGLQGSTSN